MKFNLGSKSYQVNNIEFKFYHFIKGLGGCKTSASRLLFLDKLCTKGFARHRDNFDG